MESELGWGPAWADLPPELLAIISDCVQEAPDITSFRGVCRSWRFSSVTPVPINKISPFFPHRLASWEDDSLGFGCNAHPKYLIASAVYLVRSKKASTSAAAAFMVSIQESKPGKLLLRNALTYEPIADPFPHSSSPTGYSLDLSGWTLTPIAISHNFHCPGCSVVPRNKVVLVPNPDPPGPGGRISVGGSFVVLYRECGGPCLSSTDAGASLQLVAGSDSVSITDLVNFNGRLYAIDTANRVYLLDHTGSRLLPLMPCDDDNSINNVFGASSQPDLRRFVVSDGGLYLVLSLCEEILNFTRHRFHIYKLVMDDINNATRYSLETVENLGDRVFIINQDCSFSVTARDLLLPPPLLGNCIIVARSAIWCRCCGELPVVYHPGGPQGHPERRVPRPAYSALFNPPPLWICANQDNQRKKRRID